MGVGRCGRGAVETVDVLRCGIERASGRCTGSLSSLALSFRVRSSHLSCLSAHRPPPPFPRAPTPTLPAPYPLPHPIPPATRRPASPTDRPHSPRLPPLCSSRALPPIPRSNLPRSHPSAHRLRIPAHHPHLSRTHRRPPCGGVRRFWQRSMTELHSSPLSHPHP